MDHKIIPWLLLLILGILLFMALGQFPSPL